MNTLHSDILPILMMGCAAWRSGSNAGGTAASTLIRMARLTMHGARPEGWQEWHCRAWRAANVEVVALLGCGSCHCGGDPCGWLGGPLGRQPLVVGRTLRWRSATDAAMMLSSAGGGAGGVGGAGRWGDRDGEARLLGPKPSAPTGGYGLFRRGGGAARPTVVHMSVRR